jgi:phage tail tape-measure protein
MSDSIVSGQQGGFKAPQAAVDNSPSLMSTLGSAAGSAAGGYIGGEVIGMALTPALGPLGPIVGKALGSALGGSLGSGNTPPPAQTPTGPEENALQVQETVVAAPPPLNPGLALAQSDEEEQKYYNRLGGNTYGV